MIPIFLATLATKSSE